MPPLTSWTKIGTLLLDSKMPVPIPRSRTVASSSTLQLECAARLVKVSSGRAKLVKLLMPAETSKRFTRERQARRALSTLDNAEILQSASTRPCARSVHGAGTRRRGLIEGNLQRNLTRDGIAMLVSLFSCQSACNACTMTRPASDRQMMNN